MDKSLFYLVFLIAGITTIGCGNRPLDEHPDIVTDGEQAFYTEQVNKILSDKIGLISKMSNDPIIKKAIFISNQQNRELDKAEVQKRDARWRQAQGIDSFIKPYLSNPCAKTLKRFQDNNQGFAEIFITDIIGLNVCQTNKTSDLYQADEEWWQTTYAEGKGHAYFGKIDYDESAQSESISIFVPIYDESNNILGIVKAVVDISQIKFEL